MLKKSVQPAAPAIVYHQPTPVAAAAEATESEWPVQKAPQQAPHKVQEAPAWVAPGVWGQKSKVRLSP